MERTAQETQGLYWFGPPLWCNTLLQCVVWWIASWADDDEQYKEEQPREGLFLAGAMNCKGEFSRSFYWFPDDDLDASTLWVASPIYRQRPWASSQILSGKGANNWPF